MVNRLISRDMQNANLKTVTSQTIRVVNFVFVKKYDKYYYKIT